MLKTTQDHSGADVHPEKKLRENVTKAVLTSVSGTHSSHAVKVRQLSEQT